MKKIIIVLVFIVLIVSGCGNSNIEDSENISEVEAGDKSITRKSPKELIRKFKNSYPSEEIIYPAEEEITDMDNDGYKDVFLITGSINPKIWYVPSYGETELLLEAWGSFKSANILDIGNQKHLAIMCTNDPSITQVWVFNIKEDKPNQIFTSVSNQSIRIKDNGFNLVFVEHDDEGKSVLKESRYIWDKDRDIYTKTEIEIANNDKSSKGSDLNNDKNPLEDKDINDDPSIFDKYYDSSLGKYGYKNEKGEIIIQPLFNYAGKFFEGAAIASKENEKYGFIDKSGDWIIEPIYDNAKEFSEGLAAVLYRDKWGYINQDGKTIIDFEFDEANRFSEGLVAVKIVSDWGYVDKEGNIVAQPQFDTHNEFKDGRVDVKIGGKHGVMNKNGKVIWDIVDTYKEVRVFPKDSLDSHPEFKGFYEEFITALKNKDVIYLSKHISDEIQFNFEYPLSKEQFLDYWDLKENPNESRLWQTMQETLVAGGVFKDENKFIAPYVFVNFPEEFDPLSYGVCKDNNVSVHIEPNNNSMIMKNLDHLIVKVIDWNVQVKDKNGKINKWLKIQLPGGSKGYVYPEDIISPVGYKIQISKDEKGIWKIDFFIAGE
ncbi:MAG: WG repeat-containing protein [Firmicutes bacterium]|nr:WG repeat-containing protein [Bacillota bacterium]